MTIVSYSHVTDRLWVQALRVNPSAHTSGLGGLDGRRARDAELFTLPPAVIRTVHRLEPWLKRNKDRLRFLCSRRAKPA
jgi:hypothetical protein